MIVRILGDGQFELDQAAFEELEDLDKGLDDALGGSDEPGFASGLEDALELVHAKGKRLEADVLKPSDLVLPGAGMTIDEVRALLSSETVGI